MSAPKVSIVLLNWNGERFLSDCLDAVFAQEYEDIEVTVIDNASTDGSVALLERQFGGKIRLIKNEDNVGFSRAMNQGMRASSGELLMPLNYDINMEPGYVANMVEALMKDPGRGSVSGKLLRFDEQGTSDILDSTGHIIFKNRYAINRGEDKLDTGQYDSEDLVFGVTGAAPLYRKTMLDDIAWRGEYFDESFFIMLEDLDLDWRAQLRGWKCAYTPAAVAYHYRTASGAGKSRLIQRHYYKNRYLMILKNDHFLNWLTNLPQIMLMDVYLNLDILFTSPIALVQAWYDLVRLLPLSLSKRRHIKKSRKATRAEIREWLKPYRWMNDVRRKLGLRQGA